MEKLNKILILFSNQLLVKQFKNCASEFNNAADLDKKNLKNPDIENILKEELDVITLSNNQILNNKTKFNFEIFSKLENSKCNNHEIHDSNINKNLCNPIKADHINYYSTKNNKNSNDLKNLDEIESQKINNNPITIKYQKPDYPISSKNDYINFNNSQTTQFKNINTNKHCYNYNYNVEEDLNSDMIKSESKKVTFSSEENKKKNFLCENYFSFKDEIEEMKFFEDKYLNFLYLFPNYHLNMINKKDLRAIYNVNNLLSLQLKYEKKLLNFNPNLFYQTSFLNFSPFEEPKLNFFAYVFDIDNFKSTTEIYIEEIWGKTLKDFLKICAANKNPIQLIEISSVNTMLVSSNGKVYSWGWGLKNKKNENNNDKKNYIENEFENINYKIIDKHIERISDFTHEENLNNQYAIRSNLTLDKNNSEAAHDYNSNFINDTNLNLNMNTQRDLSVDYLDNDLRTENMKNIDNNKINKENLSKKQRIDKKNNCHNNKYKNNSTYNTENFNQKKINKLNSGHKTKEKEIKKINTRNSGIMLNRNLKNKRAEQKDISAERYSLEDNNVIKNLEFSDELQKDKSGGQLNKNNEITFYDNKSLNNDKYENHIQMKDINYENQTKINKKINENIYKNDFDFITGIKKVENELRDNFKNSNENSVNIANPEIRNSATHSSINTNRDKVSGHFEIPKYVKNKQKIIEQIFSQEILESYQDKISSEFNYINNPILIEKLLCRSICLSEDFALFISKSNINLHLMGNNEKNNLSFGNKIFLNEPVDYFLNIKNELNKKFDFIQNDPNSTPEDFEELFRIAEDFSKTFFNKTKIVTAKSYGKGFIILDNKGQTYYVSDLFCKNLIDCIPHLMNYNNIKISQIECGKNFTILLSTTGQLYSHGENKYGQLGQGDFENRNFICEVPNFKEAGIKTVQISCGFKHVVIRASNNKVYTWGNVIGLISKINCILYNNLI